jgi:hypothetical protein
MYRYKYIDDTPRDFPTLGYREVKKNDVIESEEELNSPFLEEIIEDKKEGEE